MTALLAVTILLGRIAVATLPLFEDRIAAIARERGIEIVGLAGHWHLFNPVVHVDDVHFAAGRAHDVTAELDVFESAFRRAWIVRRISAAQIDVQPLRDKDGLWSLGGRPAAGGGGPITI